MTIIWFVFSIILALTVFLGETDKNSVFRTRILCILLCIALGLLGSSIEPKVEYDLARHYMHLDRIRVYNFSIREYLEYGYLYTDMNFKYTYVFNILLCIIAKTLPNTALPFIAISLSYGVYFYIYLDTGLAQKGTLKRITSFALFSILLPYIFIYSGIRNALASSIIALAVYHHITKKRPLIPIIESAIAIMIHPASFAVVPFILLSSVKPKFWNSAAVLLIPSMIFNISEFFRLQLGNEFLFRISAKYYNYLLVRNDSQGRVYLYAILIS